MAYVIFTANGDEIDRRELTRPVTIGRAQDCDVPIRDILLSRKHCRIEPSGATWIAIDLGSKNGTHLGDRTISRHQLNDGDELLLGRVRMTFRAGAFEPAPPGTRRREVVRPADPTEALAGTVAGFRLVEPGEVEHEAGAPVPQPRPPEPSSYSAEDVYGMLSEIASSSWDSIMAQASRPLIMERPLPRPHAYKDAPRVTSRRRVAFFLQAPAGEAATEADDSSTENPQGGPRRQSRASRWWRKSARVRHQIVLGMLSAVVTALTVGAWVAAVNQGPPATHAAPLPPAPAVRRDAAPELTDITFPGLSKLPAQPPFTTVGPVDVPGLPQAVKVVLRVAAVHVFAGL